MNNKDTLYIVDFKSIFYRLTQTKQDIGNVFNTVVELIQQHEGFTSSYNSDITFVMDSVEKGVNWRNKMLPSYKENRKVKTRRESKEIEVMRKIYSACCKHLVQLPFVQVAPADSEADDLVYSVCKHWGASYKEIKIITPDRDLFLINYFNKQEIPVYIIPIDTKDSNVYKDKIMLKSGGEEQYFTPEQLYYYKVMVGDSADNIKGIRGFGRVAFLNFLAKNPNLEDGLNAYCKEAAPNKVAEVEIIKQVISFKLLTKDTVKQPVPITYIVNTVDYDLADRIAGLIAETSGTDEYIDLSPLQQF